MTSASTRFFAHPNEINPTFKGWTGIDVSVTVQSVRQKKQGGNLGDRPTIDTLKNCGVNMEAQSCLETPLRIPCEHQKKVTVVETA